MLASYLEVHTKALPDLVDEVRGLSLGASVPFNLLFAINLQSELLQLITPTHANTGCSDYHISSPTGQAWAHNEDGPKSSLTYMVNSTVAGDNYVAFTYPGQLAGWAWAVTGKDPPPPPITLLKHSHALLPQVAACALASTP